MIRVAQILVAYIQEIPGHQNSEGEEVPFVIKSHDTGKILSAHKTRELAKESLKKLPRVG